MIKIKQKFIVVLLLTLLMLLSVKVYAYNTLTKENLTEAFNAYTKENTDVAIQVTDTQIVYEDKSAFSTFYENNTHYINYQLGAKTIFSIKTEINAESKLKTIKDLGNVLEKPVYGMAGVLIVEGLEAAEVDDWYRRFDVEISPLNYELMGYANNELTIQKDGVEKVFKEGEFSVSEIVDTIATNKNVVDQYGTYTYSVIVNKVSTDNYTIEVVLEVDVDKVYEKVADYNNMFNNNTNSSSNNSQNNNSNKNNVINSESNSSSKLPQTGVSNGVIYIAFVAIILVLIAVGIKLTKYRDIR